MGLNVKQIRTLVVGGGVALATGLAVGLTTDLATGAVTGLIAGIVAGFIARARESSNDEELKPPGIRRIYVAEFRDRAGGIATERDPEGRNIGINGEILISSPIDQEQILTVDELRLWSVEPQAELEGLFALGGATNKIAFERKGDGQPQPFNMRIYYPRLSGPERDPIVETDAVYPRLESFQGSLNLNVQRDAGEELEIEVTVEMIEPLTRIIGAVQRFSFKENVLFKEAIEQDQVLEKSNSLTACSSLAPSGSGYVQRSLGLRFVNLSLERPDPVAPPTPTVKQTVQKLIDRACEVWWTKGGIRIEPEANFQRPSDAQLHQHNCTSDTSKFCVSNETEERALADLSESTDTVEVYLVDELLQWSSGGVTYEGGTYNAFVILEIKKAEHNPYLLAHEVGHVLGLSHPVENEPITSCPQIGEDSGTDEDPQTAITPASMCTVMVPHQPASNRNSDHNLAMATCSRPMGSVFTVRHNASGNPLGCGRAADKPKNFYFFIRATPEDNGTIRPLPVPISIQETQSDVWCAHQLPHSSLKNKYADGTTSIFQSDHTPNHFDPILAPVGMAPTEFPNFMYARIHTCQNLVKTVTIHFYLAAQGKPIQSLGSFALDPQPGFPRARFLGWRIEDLDNNYKTGIDAWAFAVAVSGEDNPTNINALILNPASHNFNNLRDFARDTNNVAQRKLTIPALT